MWLVEKHTLDNGQPAADNVAKDFVVRSSCIMVLTSRSSASVLEIVL